MFDVDVGPVVTAKAHRRYGTERTGEGAPSEYDFFSRPLSSALIEFRHFDELPEVGGASLRSVTVVDPFFGVVTFIGVLVTSTRVEIADFDDDPDYWSVVDPPLD